MGLAEVYEDKGLYPEAIDEYRKVVEQDAKNTGALYNLALVYEKVDPKESIALWERYIAARQPPSLGEGLGGRRPPAPAQAEVARQEKGNECCRAPADHAERSGPEQPVG